LLFGLYPLRFSFRARDELYFPPGKSSNILRGAFGTLFRRMACTPDCPGAKVCEHRATCPYARIFEPSSTTAGPSGLADWPRPFVFRATHLDGRTLPAGTPFHFDLNFFDMAHPAIAYFVLTFAQLAREGLGPKRCKVDLLRVTQLHPAAEIYTGDSMRLEPPTEPLEIDLAKPTETTSRITIRFLTPTELKTHAALADRPEFSILADRPEFSILAARARDRISALRALYGPGPLDLDFRAFGDRATAIRMTRCDTKQIDITRRSTKTGQQHSIGGFIGEADYEGDLTEFLPYLRAAEYTGIGRQTVWGKGQISVSTEPRFWTHRMH